jgi:hypothetical protein
VNFDLQVPQNRKANITAARAARTCCARRNRSSHPQGSSANYSVSSPLINLSHVDTKRTATHAPNPAQMTSATLTDFKFIGNPSSNANRLKTLTHGGPLVVATDHRLVT